MSDEQTERLTRKARRVERKRHKLEEKLRKLEDLARQEESERSESASDGAVPQASTAEEAEPTRSASDLTPEQRQRRYLLGQVAVVVVLLTFPWLPIVSYSILGRANLAAQYALIAISLVVLTGWVGQVSLGQAAFVGMGAYVTGIANEAWGLAFPVNLVVGIAAGAVTATLLGTVALRVRGLYLAVATLIFSWTADAFLFQQEWLTGHSSIEVDPIGEPGTYPFLDFTSRRTFYYAAWATVALVIFAMANLRDRKVGRAFFAIRGSEMAAASLGIDVVRTKLTAFALSGAVAGLAGSLTLVGAQVVVPEQFSLSSSLFFLAIAVVGGLTSLPGAVASGMLFAAMEELFFRFPVIGDYLQLFSAGLLAAVLLLYPGGLAALGRAFWQRLEPRLERVTTAVLARIEPVLNRRRARAEAAMQAAVAGPDAEPVDSVEGMPATDARRREVPRWLEPVTRLVRGPLDRFRTMQEARRQVREAAVYVDFAAALRVQQEEDEAGAQALGDPGLATAQAAGNGSSSNGEGEDFPDHEYLSWEDIEVVDPEMPTETRQERRPLIQADRITVRFGGLTAVNDVSLAVRQGEIVGLIGPNGAGKTTMFNSIAGFNTPAEGQVTIHGIEVTTFPVYLRGRLGVARTFQAIQLFPQLNVFENLMVATYVADSSGLFGNMFTSNRSLIEEMNARQKVAAVIRLLGLEEVGDRRVSDLPFGVLRMVEVARALVTGAPVIMLDEPASGLDEIETQRLSKLIRFIRSLGVTILLIEHDVQMVTSISDYMYVIDQGTSIAEGTPEEIKRNPTVIAAYLGEETEEESEPAEAVEVGS